MNQRLKTSIDITACVFYTCCVFYITVFSRDAGLIHSIQSVPFWAFKEFLHGNHSFIDTFILNILLFVPMGYLLAALNERYCKYSKAMIPAACCLALSILIELTQFITFRGLCDTDDLISNFTGGLIGVAVFRFFEKLEASAKVFIPISFVIFGVAACIAASNHGHLAYEREFAFDITGAEQTKNQTILEGVCYVYDHPTPGYQIILRNEDTDETAVAKTVISGNTFTASAELKEDQKYAVDIDFTMRPPINTKVYIRNREVEYVGGTIAPLSAPGMEEITDHGVLKEYNEENDVFVYQYHGKIYWFIGQDIPQNSEIIYHLYTNEPERLPAERQRWQFDNRGFFADDRESEYCGRYRVFAADIPTDYAVTSISTGFSTEGEICWIDSFRPVMEH